jgi:hypothetical protein
MKGTSDSGALGQLAATINRESPIFVQLQLVERFVYRATRDCYLPARRRASEEYIIRNGLDSHCRTPFELEVRASS